MSSKDEKPSDKELNDLLDSSLKDFDKTDKVQTPQSSDGAASGEIAENAELWNDDFFVNQAKLLGDRVNAMLANGNDQLSPEQFNLGFHKMAEAASMALRGDSAADEDSAKYAASISDALKGLKEGVDNLQAPVSETDVASMFSGLGLSEGSDTDNPFVPFMQGMMQSLLSAEVLLPSIKDLLEKYPKYMEENVDKLSTEDKERFEKQQELLGVICKDLEEENTNDSAEVKQDRFKKVLDNMQTLHEYGQLPDELIDNAGGFPGAAAADPQCPMM